MNNELTAVEIYQKVRKRIRSDDDFDIIVELEKEIDCYRRKINEMEKAYSDDGNIWFKVNQKTDSKQLHNFLLNYVPMGEVLNLYRLLKKDMEV